MLKKKKKKITLFCELAEHNINITFYWGGVCYDCSIGKLLPQSLQVFCSFFSDSRGTDCEWEAIDKSFLVEQFGRFFGTGVAQPQSSE